MSYQDTLKKLLTDGTVNSVLSRGSSHKTEVQALQYILHELGFDSIMNWQTYGADGDYGSGTTKAVKDFAKRNSLKGDGTEVTPDILKRLLLGYDIVDEIRHLQDAVKNSKVKEYYYYGSNHPTAVAALQTLLYILGFGSLLKFQQYGANGQYDNNVVAAVRAFATREGIESDGKGLNKKIAKRILSKFKPYFGDDLIKVSEPVTVTTGELHISQVVRRGKTRVIVSDGNLEAQFTKFRKGLYTSGRQKPIDFINNNKDSLSELGLTDSAVNIMVSVSENEGNLDAINTWDNSFMTFGMFQWTIGARGDPGELPALLKKIKDGDPETFNKFYGQFGLDVVNTGTISGYFSLNGNKLDNYGDKEQMRSSEWSFYFWRSGQDPAVQAFEVQHALSRIDTFYRKSAYKVNGYYISDLVTSEYGVALLLDNHVNRPGYVKPCLAEAMREMSNSNPSDWETAEELEFLNNYLIIRETYGRSPMTDAVKRASVTKKYLDRGAISAERGSFEYNP